jgi:hypothetical protein
VKNIAQVETSLAENFLQWHVQRHATEEMPSGLLKQMVKRDTTMNKVTGKILLEHTETGIPNLIVTVYDIDLNSIPETAFRTNATSLVTKFWDHIQGDRLGSVLTDANGAFVLAYEDSDFQGHNGEKRPDLMLFVTAPERSGAEDCAPILHVSCGIRQNAGRLESFLILISAATLKKAGVAVPVARLLPASNVEDFMQRRREEDDLDQKIRDGFRDTVKARLSRLHQRRQAAQKALPSPVMAMSSIAPAVRNTINYVLPSASINDANQQVIERTISQRYNDAVCTRTAVVSLTHEHRSRITDQNGQLRQDISANEFKGLVFTQRNPDSRTPTDVIRISPFALCQPQHYPDENCPVPMATPPGVNGSTPPPARDGDGTPMEVADLPWFVTRMVNTITAPEGVMQLEAAGRAQTTDVQAAVDAFQLCGGPADRPAYYEFHNLQIAFEHIWREAFDDDTFNMIRETFQVIEDLGGDPGAAFASRNSPQDLCRAGEDVQLAASEDPPAAVLQVFGISAEQWNVLATNLRTEIEGIAQRYLEQLVAFRRSVEVAQSLPSPLQAIPMALSNSARRLLAHLRSVGENLLKYADSKIEAGGTSFVRLHKLLGDLCKQLQEKYAFTIYAADQEQRSVNYGLLVTYRQKWQPLGYQVGELLKTIPLAPKESRKFRKKVLRKQRRADREVANNLKSRRDETASTDRWEQEVIAKANTRTNFQLSTESDFDLLVASGKAKTSLERDDAAVSEEVKKEFHEAVVKSAEDVKWERTVEINTETAEEVEEEETGEISNPNEELPVTFLFYDLQRRYRISEQIYRLRPVILVAQEVPAPHEINEAWLVAHDWILRRVILDDSFLPALTYLATRLAGDEFALEQLRKTMEMQRRVMNDIKEEVAVIREQAGQRYAALERSIQRRADVIEENEGEGFFESIGEAFVGSSGESEEAARIREEASKDAYERAAREEKELRARLEREVTALNAATEAYTKALAQHVNARAQIERLRVHVKENILYYMQAIYRHEPPDQRFFRLHTVRVPELTGTITYAAWPSSTANTQPQMGTSPVAFEARIDLNLPLQWTTLAEVADLDNLLGFKGNYMIFPLKASNPLTEFMMAPYVDAALGVHDPDDIGNWTLEEYAEYVCCLSQNFPTTFASYRDSLRQEYQRLLSAPRRTSDEITLPSGSLYIEALPGAHPILEDFKLRHRAMDVLKVQAEVRKAELENLRMAARLLSAEFEDPDVDRRIVVEGNSNLLVSPDGN